MGNDLFPYALCFLKYIGEWSIAGGRVVALMARLLKKLWIEIPETLTR